MASVVDAHSLAAKFVQRERAARPHRGPRAARLQQGTRRPARRRITVRRTASPRSTQRRSTSTSTTSTRSTRCTSRTRAAMSGRPRSPRGVRVGPASAVDRGARTPRRAGHERAVGSSPSQPECNSRNGSPKDRTAPTPYCRGAVQICTQATSVSRPRPKPPEPMRPGPESPQGVPAADQPPASAATPT